MGIRDDRSQFNLNRYALAARASVLLLSTGLFACSAGAEPVSLTCEERDAGQTSQMTMIYEGDAQGTLKVKGSFGEMALPASKETREGEVDGKKTSVMGIRASGPATVLMPDKAAIEACVTGKLDAEQIKDEDIVFATMSGCRAEAPLSKAPIAINAMVEIAALEPPGAYVFMTRTFVEPTTLPGGKITVDSLPPPNCTISGQ